MTLETGDAAAWSEALAEDALVIGTDEAEWRHGKVAAVRAIQQQVTELHEAGVRYSASDPQLYPQLTAAGPLDMDAIATLHQHLAAALPPA